MTSRDLGLLQRNLPTICSISVVYLHVETLSEADSRELLCMHAFGQPTAPGDLAALACEVADICAGLPLTLTVTGSFLAVHRSPEAWREVCHNLRQAKPPDGQLENDTIFASLRASYTCLHPSLQDKLMDVACVLLGVSAAHAVCAWSPGGLLELENLRNLSLVTVEDGMLGMHDQIRDMLRRQARAGIRSRHAGLYAWGPDAREILTGQKVSRGDPDHTGV